MNLNCPVCKKVVPGYSWQKTKNNKNWLKHPEKGWHSCDNKKYTKKEKKKYYSIDRAPVSPESGFESNESGYYCRLGHILGGISSVGDSCPKCNEPTAIIWLR